MAPSSCDPSFRSRMQPRNLQLHGQQKALPLSCWPLSSPSRLAHLSLYAGTPGCSGFSGIGWSHCLLSYVVPVPDSAKSPHAFNFCSDGQTYSATASRETCFEAELCSGAYTLQPKGACGQAVSSRIRARPATASTCLEMGLGTGVLTHSCPSPVHFTPYKAQLMAGPVPSPQGQ